MSLSSSVSIARLRALWCSPDPCIVVIFGASGDLTKRKLLPALYHLEQAGFCRRTSPWSAWRGGRWRHLCGGHEGRHRQRRRRGRADDPSWTPFIERISYHAMNFDDDAGYDG
jgi:glucose-6-phosphate 1-dehydrogenase